MTGEPWGFQGGAPPFSLGKATGGERTSQRGQIWHLSVEVLFLLLIALEEPRKEIPGRKTLPLIFLNKNLHVRRPDRIYLLSKYVI